MTFWNNIDPRTGTGAAQSTFSAKRRLFYRPWTMPIGQSLDSACREFSRNIFVQSTKRVNGLKVKYTPGCGTSANFGTSSGVGFGDGFGNYCDFLILR